MPRHVTSRTATASRWCGSTGRPPTPWTSSCWRTARPCSTSWAPTPPDAVVLTGRPGLLLGGRGPEARPHARRPGPARHGGRRSTAPSRAGTRSRGRGVRGERACDRGRADPRAVRGPPDRVGRGKLGLTELRAGVPYPAVAMAVVRAELSPAAARRLVLGSELIGMEEALGLELLDELRPGGRAGRPGPRTRAGRWRARPRRPTPR